uniref:Uncharacterized protein n=1 Tax=Lutzomyia longipalpis TaxID=7200 RepID=A0A1B0CW36_LUTLO
MDSPNENENQSIQYWKDRATYLKHELEEFTESSHQLEQELEYQLKLKEEQIRELRLKLNKQQQENEMMRLKLIKSENEITQLDGRYQSEKREKEEMHKYTRENMWTRLLPLDSKIITQPSWGYQRPATWMRDSTLVSFVKLSVNSAIILPDSLT